MRKRLLSIFAAFVWIPAAQAATLVWFETRNTAGNPGWNFGPGGAPGTPLVLNCESFDSTTCTWQVSMKAAVGQGGIHAWSLDLRTAPGNGLSLINPQIPAGSPFNSPAFPGTGGSDTTLLTFAAGQTFTPVQPQTLTLLTFTLRRTIAVGDLSQALVFGGPSANDLIVWTNGDASDYEVVQFGSNPPAPGIEGTIAPLPLIMIGHFHPEPSTLALLTVGTAICMHRRRGRRIGGGA